MTSFQIQGPWPGLLAIVFRPRGGEWLDDEIRALKEAGFDLLVSLLTINETEDLGLTKEAELSQARGCSFTTSRSLTTTFRIPGNSSAN